MTVLKFGATWRSGVLRGLGAVVLVSLAGCGGGRAAAPEGWERFERGYLSVDVPEGWTESPLSDEVWDLALEDGTGDEVTTQLTLGVDTGWFQDTSLAALTLITPTVFSGPQVREGAKSMPVEEADLEVHRAEFTYDGGVDDSGQAVTGEGVFWTARDPGSGRTVAVRVTGLDLDQELVAQIEGSIRVLDEPVADAASAGAEG